MDRRQLIEAVPKDSEREDLNDRLAVCVPALTSAETVQDIPLLIYLQFVNFLLVSHFENIRDQLGDEVFCLMIVLFHLSSVTVHEEPC